MDKALWTPGSKNSEGNKEFYKTGKTGTLGIMADIGPKRWLWRYIPYSWVDAGPRDGVAKTMLAAKAAVEKVDNKEAEMAAKKSGKETAKKAAKKTGKKTRSAAQRANDKRLGEMARARHAAKAGKKPTKKTAKKTAQSPRARAIADAAKVNKPHVVSAAVRADRTIARCQAMNAKLQEENATLREQLSKKRGRKAKSVAATVAAVSPLVPAEKPRKKTAKKVGNVSAQSVIKGVIPTMVAPSRKTTRSGRKPSAVYVCAGPRFSGCGGGKKGSHVLGHIPFTG